MASLSRLEALFLEVSSYTLTIVYSRIKKAKSSVGWWGCTPKRNHYKVTHLTGLKGLQAHAVEKVYFRSQILEHPSIGEYWNIFGVPVLPENVIFKFFRTCWCYLEAYNTGTQKWSSIVQYSCTSIWDLKYTFSHAVFPNAILLWYLECEHRYLKKQKTKLFSITVESFFESTKLVSLITLLVS